MSRVKIRVREDYFATLDKALARPEEVVFLYATFADCVFEVVRLEVMVGADLASQTALHVELSDDVRPRVIKAAWDRDECLIEAHSHGPSGHAEFSPSDMHGFSEWVPHVRWRLQHRPYAALVKAGETWDALAWVDGPEPTLIDLIEITDGETMTSAVVPTNATAATLAERRPTT